MGLPWPTARPAGSLPAIRWSSSACGKSGATMLHKFVVFHASRLDERCMARRSGDELRRAHPRLTITSLADADLIERTANAWTFFDGLVCPFVTCTTFWREVARAGVKRISTTGRDIIRLLTGVRARSRESARRHTMVDGDEHEATPTGHDACEHSGLHDVRASHGRQGNKKHTPVSDGDLNHLIRSGRRRIFAQSRI